MGKGKEKAWEKAKAIETSATGLRTKDISYTAVLTPTLLEKELVQLDACPRPDQKHAAKSPGARASGTGSMALYTDLQSRPISFSFFSQTVSPWLSNGKREHREPMLSPCKAQPDPMQRCP